MAKTLTSSIKASITWDHQSAQTLANTTDAGSKSFSKSTTNGTGAAGTADLKYAIQYTLAASTRQQIDLAGSLVDEFGATITFARIKALYIEVVATADDATSTGASVLVGGGTDGAGTNAFVNWINTAATEVRLYNGTCMLIGGTGATQYAVTAGTGDILAILNEDASNQVKVNVVLIGSSA